MIEHADVVIAGGGASGLAAAAELGMSSADLNVVIIEKNNEPGKKIRATGSGRCNITNTRAEGYNEILRFFTGIGLMTRTYENGLVYPYSESAADVAELLTARAIELGTRIVTGAEVTGVRFGENGGFETEYVTASAKGKRRHVISSDHVILALGSKAGPSYGCTGDGYAIARSLGHSIVTPVPVLTGIECREWDKDAEPCAITLAGTRSRGEVILSKVNLEKCSNDRRDGTDCSNGSDRSDIELFKEKGEIQFTRYGLSGICVFNMTRHMRYDRSAGESIADFKVTADLFPDGDIAQFLRDRRSNAFPGEKAADVLRTVLKENIAEYVIARAGRNAGAENLASENVSEMSDKDISALADAVHRLEFRPSGIRGWKEAQAAMGGVDLREIDAATNKSLLAEGLYITGELADRDYECGGFNLSNAWLTGIRAADAISSK